MRLCVDSTIYITSEWEYIREVQIVTMKLELALCILAATFACLEAAPLQTEWYELLPSTTLKKKVGDIWSNCSKLPTNPWHSFHA